MKHNHFQQTLRSLGTTKQAGAELSVTDRTVANWLKGQFPLAVDVLFKRPELALAVLLDSIEGNPHSPLAKNISLETLYPQFKALIENTTPNDGQPEPINADPNSDLEAV